MPELPEVETVMRGLAPVLNGQRFKNISLRRANLRFPFAANFVSTLVGAKVTHLTRRAKYILVHCDNGNSLLVHLGMTGRFSVSSPQQENGNLGVFYFDGAGSDGSGPHDHVVFELENQTRIIYSDPRRFGMMDVLTTDQQDAHVRLKDIGVEPLGNQFNGAHLAEKFRNRKSPLKSALLDQHVVAGLGNIYVNEALHRAKLSPLRIAQSLVRPKSYDQRLDNLARHIRDILHEAIVAGGSTLQDFVGADGAVGAYQQQFSVYDQKDVACRTALCNGIITRIVQSGRSTFYCPKCQK